MIKVILIRIAAIATFALLFVGGYWLVGRGTKTGAPRTPAAIPKATLFDFSSLEDSALDRAARKRILQGAKSIAKDGRVGISLGHFLTRTNDGTAALACEVYDNIQLEFEAEGVATSGERPKLIVKAPCRANEDLTLTRPIWIPLDKILQNSPADGEYSYLEETPVSVRFQNMDFAWPRHWVLARVQFETESEKGRAIFIDRKEIYETSSVPLTMLWPEPK